MKKTGLIAVCLLGLGCESRSDPAALELTPAHAGKTVKAKVGQTFVVSLRGNPTTGFRWELAGIEGEAVVPDGEISYSPDPHLPGMVGVGGTFTARFRAVQPGRAVVRLRYRRPWEPENQTASRVEVMVEVTSD